MKKKKKLKERHRRLCHIIRGKIFRAQCETLVRSTRECSTVHYRVCFADYVLCTIDAVRDSPWLLGSQTERQRNCQSTERGGNSLPFFGCYRRELMGEPSCSPPRKLSVVVGQVVERRAVHRSIVGQPPVGVVACVIVRGNACYRLIRSYQPTNVQVPRSRVCKKIIARKKFIILFAFSSMFATQSQIKRAE